MLVAVVAPHNSDNFPWQANVRLDLQSTFDLFRRPSMGAFKGRKAVSNVPILTGRDERTKNMWSEEPIFHRSKKGSHFSVWWQKWKVVMSNLKIIYQNSLPPGLAGKPSSPNGIESFFLNCFWRKFSTRDCAFEKGPNFQISCLGFPLKLVSV